MAHRRTIAILRLSAFAVTALGVCGCIVPGFGPLPKSKVDMSSPVAKDVIAAEKHPGPYPKFADIPKLPTDVRPAPAWKSQVQDLDARRSTLEAEVAALPPPQTETEAYAARTRARAAGADQAPPADSRQQTEAFAKALRERATPPPPPN